jgi:hypothetical protein
LSTGIKILTRATARIENFSNTLIAPYWPARSNPPLDCTTISNKARRHIHDRIPPSPLSVLKLHTPQPPHQDESFPEELLSSADDDELELPLEDDDDELELLLDDDDDELELLLDDEELLPDELLDDGEHTV